MSEPAIINAVGVFKGQIENGVLYYHAVGEDAEGDQVVLLFGCQPNFSEAIDKAFSRLFPVRFKAADTVKPLADTIDISPKGDTINEA
jgi:hypothetical protein